MLGFFFHCEEELMKAGPRSWLLCSCRSKHRGHSDPCLFCLHHYTVLWPRVSCAFIYA